MDQITAKEIADKVAAVILRSGYSKSAVSQGVGVPATTFNRKINGHVEFTFSELLKIAKFLGESPSAFLPNAFISELRVA